MSGQLRSFVQARSEPKWSLQQDRLMLESQVWKGGVWHHEILIAEPSQGRAGDAAILEITGDNVADEDLVWARRMADLTGLPVFVLCQVPNQPLWDMREDHLIAFTFEQFLETGDEDWPLLFPMTLASVSAIDAIQEWSGGRLNHFVVTGASKRGWTTWLAGALEDPRIIGLAPRLFDNLHFLRQSARQQRFWHSFSKEIDPYIERSLPQRFQTPEGLELLRRVDPWYSLDEINVPVLLLHGALDPFWMIDAIAEYWEDIPVPKWCLINPLRGHEMWPVDEWGPTLAAFADACRLKAALPQPQAVTLMQSEDVLLLAVDPAEEISGWFAHALLSTAPRLFTQESESFLLTQVKEAGSVVALRQPGHDVAVIPSMEMNFMGRSFPLSLPPIVIDRPER